MIHRQARTGAALAGALLIALPTLDVLLTAASPAPVKFVVGGFGVALIALSRKLR
jgi:hypothetical protein